MLSPAVTSGDAVADRRLVWAEALFAEGDAAGAAELLSEVTVPLPGWTAGWYRLGEFREAAGDTAGAATAFDAALAADPADRLGAILRRDLLRRVPLAETMPPAYVETLFDAYAPAFDAALEALGYRGPELVAQAVAAGGAASRVLDLGCGTGLLGVALEGLAERLDGMDISAEMLALAAARGCYARLDKADVNALPPAAPSWDLIAAADVVMYLGALERLVGWVAGALLPGGRFVFTAEALEGEGFALGEARRYRHSERYLRGVLNEAGFAVAEIGRAVVRHDRGVPVEALVVSARLETVTRPSARPDAAVA